MSSWPSLSSNQIREPVFLVCLFVFKTGPCYVAQTDLKLGSFSFRLLDAEVGSPHHPDPSSTSDVVPS